MALLILTEHNLQASHAADRLLLISAQGSMKHISHSWGWFSGTIVLSWSQIIYTLKHLNVNPHKLRFAFLLTQTHTNIQHKNKSNVSACLSVCNTDGETQWTPLLMPRLMNCYLWSYDLWIIYEFSLAKNDMLASGHCMQRLQLHDSAE